jgi:ribosome-associated protein
MKTLAIDPRVFVPASALRAEFVRSSGPGGQNVNKVSSRVELHVDLDAIVGLSDAARRRLESLARRRDRDGRFLVTSQRTRDQSRNMTDCLDRVRALVLRSLVAPRARRPTAPSAGARERRISAKRHRAAIKVDRSSGGRDDD